MRIGTLLAFLTLVACVADKTSPSIGNLTLQEIEQQINGAWKLTAIQTRNEITELHINSDTLTYFEFNELKGVEINLIDNHDGTYGTNSVDLFCELKGRDHKQIIAYSQIFNDNWEKEIKKLTNDELILADSTRTWTYVRHQMKSAE